MNGRKQAELLNVSKKLIRDLVIRGYIDDTLGKVNNTAKKLGQKSPLFLIISCRRKSKFYEGLNIIRKKFYSFFL